MTASCGAPVRADSESFGVPSAATGVSSPYSVAGDADAGAEKVTASSAAFSVLCEQLLAAGHTARFSASGQSMQPTILDGDMLVIEPLSTKPRLGQIFLIRTAGKLRAHRAVCLRPRLITRGDSGLGYDAPAEKVLGKVVALERGGETISLQGRARVLIQRLRIATHRLRQAVRLHLASRHD